MEKISGGNKGVHEWTQKHREDYKSNKCTGVCLLYVKQTKLTLLDSSVVYQCWQNLNIYEQMVAWSSDKGTDSVMS